MRSWVDHFTGERYGGDKRHPDDFIAPVRPSTEHQWVAGEWQLPADVEDREAAHGVEALPPRFLFEILFAMTNDIRDLRRKVNAVSPGAYTTTQSAAVTRAQYLSMLKNLYLSMG